MAALLDYPTPTRAGRHITIGDATSVLIRICTGRTAVDAQARATRWGWTDPHRTLCGTPAEIVESLARYSQLGVTRAYCQVVDFEDLDHLELVARMVMPAMA